MDELRVPTIARMAEVACADGRVLVGRVFIPDGAFRHSGPMRPEEWINEPTAFFPFLLQGDERPVLLNKEQVVVVTLLAPPADEPGQNTEGAPAVVIDCGAVRVEGELRLDMPEGHRRVLDMLNVAERFLAVYAGERQHLVHKRHVTRVLENRGR
jgi:hypothetical protein